MSTQVPRPPNTDASAFSAAGAAAAANDTTATARHDGESAAHAATVGRDHEDDVKAGSTLESHELRRDET